MNYEDLIPKWKNESKQIFLDDFDTSVSKMVRNISYQQCMEDKETDRQRDIVESIIDEYPEGITDRGISIETGLPISTVCARRNEIPRVTAIGLITYVNENGRNIMNTLWGKL